jgi:hypothetical protein
VTDPQPTARQKLIEAMRTRTCFCGADSCHNAEQYVNAYAHELAEQQRKHWIPRPPGETADYVRGLDDGFDKAADLIDPEPQR